MDEIRKLSNKEEKVNNIEEVLHKRIRMQILLLVASVLVVLVLVFAMTAAWFTNVAKTSDLVFQTESWGFEEEKIILSENSISISPGKSGIIPLTIDNSDATESVQIGVTISKNSTESEMDLELQKRIFFYVEETKTNVAVELPENAENGEVTEEEIEFETESTSRVYLATSAPHNYTYTILPGQKLVINEQYYNALPIKWEWVYDMLGYYFRGTIHAEAEENKVQIDEYVRPIEYDYEKAVFDVDESSENYQQLLAVGDLSTGAFLKEISSTDGYIGVIDNEEAVIVEEKVYYPVEVDENGYGMWAYLCTLDEVKEGIAYDTELANSEKDITATATIILTAHNVPAKIESVNTEAALAEALLDESIDIIELSTDILSGSTISVENGAKVIDLNGYTMQYTGVETQYNYITVADGATLTVSNGQVQGNSNASTAAAIKTTALDLIAGNLVLSNVDISGFDCAVRVEDMNAEEAGDSTIQIINCILEAEQHALILQGNGAATANLTKVMIYDSILESEHYVAISGQGNDDRWGTELVLAESEVNGYYAGIYQPQRSSVMTISNCKITGNTGIAIKGGSVNVYDSEIIGTGEVLVEDAAASGSGFIDTGDAVYVEAVYNWPVTVNIKGASKIVSNKAFAVELFGQEEKGLGRIAIYEGAFEGTKGSANWNGIGNFEIFGGTYNSSVSENIERYDLEE